MSSMLPRCVDPIIAAGSIARAAFPGCCSASLPWDRWHSDPAGHGGHVSLMTGRTPAARQLTTHPAGVVLQPGQDLLSFCQERPCGALVWEAAPSGGDSRRRG